MADNVLIENQPSVHLTSKTTNNGSNANHPAGLVAAPSQSKVIINKAFPMSTKAGGMVFAFPNVNKTPTPAGPIPIPYPSIGMLNQVKGESRVVKAVGKGVVKGDSEIPKTQGDEAGSNGGIMSGTNGDKIAFK